VGHPPILLPGPARVHPSDLSGLGAPYSRAADGRDRVPVRRLLAPAPGP